MKLNDLYNLFKITFNDSTLIKPLIKYYEMNYLRS